MAIRSTLGASNFGAVLRGTALTSRVLHTAHSVRDHIVFVWSIQESASQRGGRSPAMTLRSCKDRAVFGVTSRMGTHIISAAACSPPDSIATPRTVWREQCSVLGSFPSAMQ